MEKIAQSKLVRLLKAMRQNRAVYVVHRKGVDGPYSVFLAVIQDITCERVYYPGDKGNLNSYNIVRDIEVEVVNGLFYTTHWIVADPDDVFLTPKGAGRRCAELNKRGK